MIRWKAPHRWALVAAALVALNSGNCWSAVVKLHGSTTVQKRIMEPGKEALKQATGIDLQIMGNGTGAGLEDLVTGKCDAAMASEEVADAVESMKKASGKGAPTGLKGNVIAVDVIKVIVNAANPINKLGKEQLKGLHTGKIQSWKEVGGADQPVIVVTSHLGSATRKVFQKVIMDDAAYEPDAIQVKTTREEIENVGQLVEGIGAVSQGFISQSAIKDKVKVVESPEISRPLMLITKGEPSQEIQKVLDFFRGEGKKYIKD